MRNIIITLMLSLFIGSACYAEEESEEEIVYETAYVKISPDIVSNVQGRAKYIRTSIQLLTNRADVIYEIQDNMPLIRHAFLMTLIDKKGEDIKTPKGKEALRKELLKTASAALNEKTETKDLLTDLFFTTYFVK